MAVWAGNWISCPWERLLTVQLVTKFRVQDVSLDLSGDQCRRYQLCWRVIFFSAFWKVDDEVSLDRQLARYRVSGTPTLCGSGRAAGTQVGGGA